MFFQGRQKQHEMFCAGWQIFVGCFVRGVKIWQGMFCPRMFCPAPFLTRYYQIVMGFIYQFIDYSIKYLFFTRTSNKKPGNELMKLDIFHISEDRNSDRPVQKHSDATAFGARLLERYPCMFHVKE